MKNVIVYGGAFNPPTNAHLAITKACIEKARELNAEVWLLPSGNRTDKTIGISSELRLRYINAFVEALSEKSVTVRVELSEFKNNILTETADTVARLNLEYPDAKFYWIFGADSILTMKDWRNGLNLFNNLDMLVIPRSGYEIELLPPKAQIINVDVPIISSTQVRELIEKKRNVLEVVPTQVAEIIMSNFS